MKKFLSNAKNLAYQMLLCQFYSAFKKKKKFIISQRNIHNLLEAKGFGLANQGGK